MTAGALLDVDRLAVSVGEEQRALLGGEGRALAVHDVTFTVGAAETVGLVGESGSGKTLTCRTVLGLLPAGAVVSSGSVSFGGADVTRLGRRGWSKLYGTTLGAVFQDPASYLNPSLRVGRQVAEALRVKQGLSRRDARARVLELFTATGLRNPQRVYRQYPHELSGGMLQRILIAIAISGNPRLLVADEPTTALDVAVQAEVLELLRRLRDERGLAVLLVSHDLALVADVCDRVVVLYAGEVVESGPTLAILTAPRHPYTEALLKVASLGSYERRELAVIPGSRSAPGEEAPGCRFASRCPYATAVCSERPVPLAPSGGSASVRCVRASELSLAGVEGVAA